ncbi:MAG TPA: DNA methyltransferase [Acetobacteraceae bacterium]|jgi:hypothetical protein|nr:DNA methyltransferase [Acetobacteraceae bacterium]
MSAAATATRRVKTGGRSKGTPNRPKHDVAAQVRQFGADSLLPPNRAKAAMSISSASKEAAKTDTAKLPPYRLVPTNDLVPYINNPMEHPPDQIDLICKLITEYGWTNPVLIDGKRGIIAGHGRVLAAQKLGMAMVPTIELRHLNDAQKRAYVMADNESARKGRWNDELRGLELGELRDLGFDLALTGFDMPEIGRLLGPADGQTDPDDAPAAEAVAVSRVGDVWILGRHRLYAADCRDVLPTLAGVDAVVTDPPYGLGFKYASHDDNRENHPAFIASWLPAVLACAPAALISPGMTHLMAYPQPAWVICWHKPAAMGRSPIGFCNWEPTLLYGKPHNRKTVDVFTAPILPDRELDGHPCPKPVQWGISLIEIGAPARGIVADPFAGSGTTIIACEQTGRACVAIEVSPQYVDVAIRRWQSFTGQEAIHEPTGRPFAAIAAERAGESVPSANVPAS